MTNSQPSTKGCPNDFSPEKTRAMLVDAAFKQQDHLFALTRNVVALNAFAGLVSGFVVNSLVPGFSPVFLGATGVVFAAFGICFNWGASKAHEFIYDAVDEIAKRITVVEQDAPEKLRVENIQERLGFNEFSDRKSFWQCVFFDGILLRVNTDELTAYGLTKLFFQICSTMWAIVGVYLVSRAMGTDVG